MKVYVTYTTLRGFWAEVSDEDVARANEEADLDLQQAIFEKAMKENMPSDEMNYVIEGCIFEDDSCINMVTSAIDYGY